MAKIKAARILASALAAGLVVPALVPLSQAAAADITVPFIYAGSSQTWTVPTDVTEVELIVVGSSGNKTAAGGVNARGGAGAVVTTTATVTPGATLTINVGGGNSSFSNGGAATVVKAGTDFLAVAGGGGGGGGVDGTDGGDGAENGTAAGGDGKGATPGGQGAPGDGSGGVGTGPSPVAGGSVGNNGTDSSDIQAGGGGGGLGGAGGANTVLSTLGGTADSLSRSTESTGAAGGPGAGSAGGGAAAFASGGGGGGYGGGGGGGFLSYPFYSGGGAGGSYAATPPVGAPATTYAPGPYSYQGIPYGMPAGSFETTGAGLVLIKYTPPPAAQTVTFLANGGSGTMPAQSSATAAALNANTFTRDGYAFAGWSTNAGGTGTAYANGATYPFTASATLFAQWVPLAGPLAFAGTDFGSVTTGSSTDLTVTVTNTGLAALTPSAITAAAVSLNTDAPGTCSTSASIAANSSCTVKLVWMPSTAGTLAGASLTIAYSGGTAANNSTSLTGLATGAPVPPIPPVTPGDGVKPDAPRKPQTTGSPTATAYKVKWVKSKNANADTRYEVRVNQRGSSKVIILKFTKKTSLTLTRKQLLKAMQRARGDVAGVTVFRVQIIARDGQLASAPATTWLRMKP